MPMGDPPTDGMVWNDATGWQVAPAPLNGFVMEPEHPWVNQAASIICGHKFIYERLFNSEQAEFEQFVREVLQTTAPKRS